MFLQFITRYYLWKILLLALRSWQTIHIGCFLFGVIILYFSISWSKVICMSIQNDRPQKVLRNHFCAVRSKLFPMEIEHFCKCIINLLIDPFSFGSNGLGWPISVYKMNKAIIINNQNIHFEPVAHVKFWHLYLM